MRGIDHRVLFRMKHQNGTGVSMELRFGIEPSAYLGSKFRGGCVHVLRSYSEQDALQEVSNPAFDDEARGLRETMHKIDRIERP